MNLPEIFIALISEMSSLSNNCDFFSLSTQTIRTHTFHGVSKRKSVELVKTTHSVHCECWQHIHRVQKMSCVPTLCLQTQHIRGLSIDICGGNHILLWRFFSSSFLHLAENLDFEHLLLLF